MLKIFLIIGVLLIGGVGVFLYFRGTSIIKKAAVNKPAQVIPKKAPEPKTLTFIIEPIKPASVSGTLVLSESQQKAQLNLNLRNTLKNNLQPASLRKGSCAKPGESVYGLSSVENGNSLTILDIPIAGLLYRAPLAIMIYRDPQNPTTPVACGDFKIR